MGICKSIINKKEEKKRYNIINQPYNNVQQNNKPNYQEKTNNTNEFIQYNNISQGQIYNEQYNPYEFNPAPVYNIQNPQLNQFNDKNNNNLQYQKTNNDNNSNNIDLNQYVDIEKKKFTTEVNKNNDYPLENENQRLEEIEDDGSIKDLKEPIKYYDLIVYCNSFKRLFDKNGWYYKYSQ